VAKPGEVSEEQHWEMLGERLKLYGASRLAEMFRSIASSADGGSRCRSESSVLSVGDDDEEEDEEEEGHLEHEDNEEGEEGHLEEAAATADWEDQTTASAVEVRALLFLFFLFQVQACPLSSHTSRREAEPVKLYYPLLFLHSFSPCLTSGSFGGWCAGPRGRDRGHAAAGGDAEPAGAGPAEGAAGRGGPGRRLPRRDGRAAAPITTGKSTSHPITPEE
jgi:hypothetical protein